MTPKNVADTDTAVDSVMQDSIVQNNIVKPEELIFDSEPLTSTMEPESPVRVPKGAYTIDWDNIDENTDPFASSAPKLGIGLAHSPSVGEGGIGHSPPVEREGLFYSPTVENTIRDVPSHTEHVVTGTQSVVVENTIIEHQVNTCDMTRENNIEDEQDKPEHVASSLDHVDLETSQPTVTPTAMKKTVRYVRERQLSEYRNEPMDFVLKLIN